MNLFNLPPTGEAKVLAARHSATQRQLDMLLDVRGPVNEVRRLVADLDRIAEDLAKTLRAPDARDS